MLLKGKVAIVTGGGRGLGEATCKLFADEGALVVVADFDFKNAKKVADEINAKFAEPIPMQVKDKELHEVKVRALPVFVNVADRATVDVMVNDVLHTFGKIDILINNAGITRDKTLMKMPDEWFDMVIGTNLTGVYNVAKAVVPHMVAQGSGKIVNTSSVVRNGNIGQTNYTASKAGVVAMTKTWAKELGRKGINVNAVAPGFMKTDMTAGMNQEALKATEAKIPLGHLGEAQDIAEAYLWLVSEKAKYVNGTVLEVDGGLVV